MFTNKYHLPLPSLVLISLFVERNFHTIRRGTVSTRISSASWQRLGFRVIRFFQIKSYFRSVPILVYKDGRLRNFLQKLFEDLYRIVNEHSRVEIMPLLYGVLLSIPRRKLNSCGICVDNGINRARAKDAMVPSSGSLPPYLVPVITHEDYTLSGQKSMLGKGVLGPAALPCFLDFACQNERLKLTLNSLFAHILNYCRDILYI